MSVELNATNTMKLLLAEALSDKKLDESEKLKIKTLANRVGISNQELQNLVNEVVANTSNEASSGRGLDPKALFSSACDVAMEDGVLSDEEKNKEIIDNTISALSLLYLPGHIMLYIGEENNKPYIIHAIWGTETTLNETEKAVSFINKVVVSSLNVGENSTKGTLLHRITKVNSLK